MDNLIFYENNQFYSQELWNAYKVYAMSLCVTGEKEDKTRIKKINYLISSFIKKLALGSFDWKLYTKIQKEIQKDNSAISDALEFFQSIRENDDEQMGDLYVEGTLGVSIW
jgi:hypothetical protein